MEMIMATKNTKATKSAGAPPLFLFVAFVPFVANLQLVFPADSTAEEICVNL
jgi:hypothetical protein